MTATIDSQTMAMGLIEERLIAETKRADQLQLALTTRLVIEQAKGILQERFGWDESECFELIRLAARSSHLKVHVLSAKIVSEPNCPHEIVIALTKSARWRAAAMREQAELHREHAAALEVRVRELQERMDERKLRVARG